MRSSVFLKKALVIGPKPELHQIVVKKIKWLIFSTLVKHMGRVKRIWYLSPMRAAKVQASLRIRAVSPEPSLLAHTSSESRGTFRQKARSLTSLNGLACAVKNCHDGMLEDTNSLDGAHITKHLTRFWVDLDQLCCQQTQMYSGFYFFYLFLWKSIDFVFLLAVSLHHKCLIWTIANGSYHMQQWLRCQYWTGNFLTPLPHMYKSPYFIGNFRSLSEQAKWG